MLILPKDKYSFFYFNGILIIAVKKMQSIEKIMPMRFQLLEVGAKKKPIQHNRSVIAIVVVVYNTNI